jgi:hypothetical protein
MSPIRHAHFNLPKQVDDLLRCMILPSCHKQFLLFQFVSSQLVQIEPGIPV